MGERPDIGFLDDVLSLAVIAQDAAGETKEPAIIRLHDGTRRRLVTGEDAADQFGIVGACGRDPGSLCLAHGTSGNTLGLWVGCDGSAKVPEKVEAGAQKTTGNP